MAQQAMKKKILSLFGILLIILLFVLVSFISQQYPDTIRGFIGNNILGMILYLFLFVITTVIAPLSSLPLVPLASAVFGPFLTAVLNILGWTAGAVIIFVLCRKYGVPLIKKFISLQKLQKIESKIPEKSEFWSVVLLRMTIPVDILSYALGLFSKIDFKRYFLATLIGITPFSFVFAYAGAFPVKYQLLALVAAAAIILISFAFSKRKK